MSLSMQDPCTPVMPTNSSGAAQTLDSEILVLLSGVGRTVRYGGCSPEITSTIRRSSSCGSTWFVKVIA